MQLYILGGSVTGGSGLNIKSRAWPNLVGSSNVVFHKNAIEPGYFLHCFKRFSPPSDSTIDAAILDFGPNMWSKTSIEHLSKLASLIKHSLSINIIIMIAWPRKNVNKDIDSIEKAAKLSNSYVIRPMHNNTLYADAVHPNENAHRMIAQQLQEFLNNITQAPRTFHKINQVTNQNTTYIESCYDNADDIPVFEVGPGWHKVNDGIRGTNKFGWRINEGNGSLGISLPIPCASIVTLGYLKTNYEGGSFSIQCDAPCMCSTIRGYHQKEIHPFPHVRTHTQQKIRVTDTTSFGIITSNASSCKIRLNGHMARIDSIYVRDATNDDFTNAAMSKRTEHRAFIEARRC